MKRSSLYFIVDFLAFVGFLLLTSTGVVLHYLLPPRSGGWLELWGLTRHEWGELHFSIAVAFFVVLALHLVLHWRWIVSAIKGRSQEHSGFRFALGMVGFLVLIAVAFSPLMSEVEQRLPNGQKHGR